MVHCLPPFLPNEYLYTKHKDKGTEKWEIYAWAVRDVMAKFGNLIKTDMPNSDKVKYKYFMRGKTDKITFAGKTFVGEKVRKNQTISRITKVEE